MSKARARQGNAGVTILEVMIVLAIMALIVGLAGPRLIDSFGRAKSQSAEIQMTNIKAALQLFYLDVGRYPTTAEGVDALVRAPSGLENWRGPYLEDQELIIDPWGRRYLLKVPGSDDKPFDIQSYGRDGQPGGTSEDSDLIL